MEAETEHDIPLLCNAYLQVYLSGVAFIPQLGEVPVELEGQLAERRADVWIVAIIGCDISAEIAHFVQLIVSYTVLIRYLNQSWI